MEWWKGWPRRGGAFRLRSTWREGKREKGEERGRKNENKDENTRRVSSLPCRGRGRGDPPLSLEGA